MKKNDFIWLIIRFSGILFLVKGIKALLRIPPLCISLFRILPAYDSSRLFGVLLITGTLVESIVDVLVIIYLLFGAKTIYKIIDRTSQLDSEGLLQRENYSEILVRFCGIWWLWKIITCIFRILRSFSATVILKYYATAITNGTDPQLEQLCELLGKLSKSFSWSSLVSILEYLILAWYFLKKGKLIINFFSIRWLGKKENIPSSSD